MSFLRERFVLLLCAALGVALLAGLGAWQMQRLHWKEDVLARIAARRDAPPAPPPPREMWPALTPDDYDYRPVIVEGVFDHTKESYLFRASATGKAGEGPSYEIVTPLRLKNDGVVFVNRGAVPEEKRDPARRPEGQLSGEVTLRGLMRAPETRNAFTPPDEPAKNLWFSRDPAALAARWGFADSAPFTIDADATPNPGGWPKGGATVLTIPNNHLSYALTWFALAITLAVVTGVFLVRSARPHDSGAPNG
jgi:surfeit locus 1 family protein